MNRLSLGLGPVRKSTESGGPVFKNIDLKTVDEVDKELDSVQLTPLVPKLSKTMNIDNQSHATGSEGVKKLVSVKFDRQSGAKIGSPRSDETTSSKRREY